MNLSVDQLNDIKHAVRFYQQRHVSLSNPRYQEYEVILQLLDEYKEDNK